MAALVALSGCAETTTQAASQHETVIQGAYVPARATLDVQLSRALDLSTYSAYAPFEAALTDDARTPQGATLLAGGARIAGHVEADPHSGLLTLRDATAETAVGPVPLHATIEVPEALAPRAAAPTAAAAPWGASPESLAREQRTEPARPADFRGQLRQGTHLRLVLTEPLLAPGARVIQYH